MRIGESRRRLGWLAWLGASGVWACVLVDEVHWDRWSSVAWDAVAWCPLIAALALQLRRDARGAVLLGGFIAAAIADALWPFYLVWGVAPFVLVLALAVVGNRLLGLDVLTSRQRITLLAAGALSAIACRGLHYDAYELWYGPNHVAPGIVEAPTTEWATTVGSRAAIELLCLGSLALTVRGRTAGLLGTVGLGLLWWCGGAAPSVREWCGCMPCPNHPISGDGAGWLAAFTALALLPWLPAMLRHLQSQR